MHLLEGPVKGYTTERLRWRKKRRGKGQLLVWYEPMTFWSPGVHTTTVQHPKDRNQLRGNGQSFGSSFMANVSTLLQRLPWAEGSIWKKNKLLFFSIIGFRSSSQRWWFSSALDRCEGLSRVQPSEFLLFDQNCGKQIVPWVSILIRIKQLPGSGWYAELVLRRCYVFL